MKNKKAASLLIQIIIVAGLLLLLFLILSHTFIGDYLKKRVGGSVDSMLKWSGAQWDAAKKGLGFQNTDTGTEPGTDGDEPGDEANGEWNVHESPVDLKTMAEWMKCDADGIRKKIKEGKASSEEQKCFSAGGVNWDDAGRCYCLNLEHIETGGADSKPFFITPTKEDKGVIVYYKLERDPAPAGNDDWVYLPAEGSEDCRIKDNLCLKLVSYEDNYKKVKIAARKAYTEPGTALEIGETYRLKQGVAYNLKSELGTHKITYKGDYTAGINIFVSNTNNDNIFGCVGAAQLWKLPINEGSCCSPKHKICGKVLERNTEYNYIKLLVCETARC